MKNQTIETSDRMAKMVIALATIAHYPLNAANDYLQLKYAVFDYEKHELTSKDLRSTNSDLTALHIAKILDALGDYIAHPSAIHYLALGKAVIEYQAHWNYEVEKNEC